MKRCPYCAEEIKDAAIKCRYCGSMINGSPWGRTWYRSRRGKMLGGVCAGLAIQFGVSVTALRLAFVILTLLGVGWGIVVYAVLWVIMPLRETPPEADLDRLETDPPLHELPAENIHHQDTETPGDASQR